MSRAATRLPRPLGLLFVVATLLVGVLAVQAPAFARVVVSRAELVDGNLRIEGQATANRTITVDGVAMTTSDGAGDFRISRSSYIGPDDCTVDVNDGSATAETVRLSGCTGPASAPTITPDVAELGPAYVGSFLRILVGIGPETTGPVSWQVIAGALPNGLVIRIPEPAGRPPHVEPTYMYIEGTPTTVQTSTFTLRATDADGLTATRTYTMVVNPARPLAIRFDTGGAPLRVGESATMFFYGSGGVLPYQWSISAGQPPPGMTLVDSHVGDELVTVSGTPTASGTFTWTMRLTDAQGSVLDSTYSASVDPASTVTALAISPATVVAGGSATGTVTISPVAPGSGASVALTSSNPAVASVPATVSVLAAASSATFTVSTAAVSTPTTVTVTASLGGVSQSATVTVEPGSADPTPVPLTAPTLLSPANDARWAPGVSQRFDWSDVSGAGGYVLQVSASSAFTTVELQRSVTASEVALSFASEGARYWRVRAVDGSGNPGPWSATRTFRIKG